MAAAAKLFAAKGFDGTTTRQIVKEAGSSLSTLQIQFKSKEALFQAVLKRTFTTFYMLNGPLLNEIDEVERQGMLNEDSSWNLIVELTGQLTEWVFCREYTDEIRLINRELLNPEPVFEEISDAALEIYGYYQKLFEAYAGAKDAVWTKWLSFSVVTSIFNYGNYSYVIGRVVDRDADDPNIVPYIKINMKQYLLFSLRAYLNMRKQDAIS
jgi:AcrR family transcriptional regulator